MKIIDNIDLLTFEELSNGIFILDNSSKKNNFYLNDEITIINCRRKIGESLLDINVSSVDYYEIDYEGIDEVEPELNNNVKSYLNFFDQKIDLSIGEMNGCSLFEFSRNLLELEEEELFSEDALYVEIFENKLVGSIDKEIDNTRFFIQSFLIGDDLLILKRDVSVNYNKHLPQKTYFSTNCSVDLITSSGDVYAIHVGLDYLMNEIIKYKKLDCKFLDFKEKVSFEMSNYLEFPKKKKDKLLIELYKFMPSSYICYESFLDIFSSYYKHNGYYFFVNLTIGINSFRDSILISEYFDGRKLLYEEDFSNKDYYEVQRLSGLSILKWLNRLNSNDKFIVNPFNGELDDRFTYYNVNYYKDQIGLVFNKNSSKISIIHSKCNEQEIIYFKKNGLYLITNDEDEKNIILKNRKAFNMLIGKG